MVVGTLFFFNNDEEYENDEWLVIIRRGVSSAQRFQSFNLLANALGAVSIMQMSDKVLIVYAML